VLHLYLPTTAVEMKNHFINICECKSVSRSEIIKSIRTGGCQTIIDIQNITGASTGCGRCKPKVLEVLMQELRRKNSDDKQLQIPF
jgi:nitrite reductase (NADH) large subunit